MTKTATGHIQVRQLKNGPVLYAAGRLPNGKQFRVALGKAWTPRRGQHQPPTGSLSKDQAQAQLDAGLDGDGPLAYLFAEASQTVTFEYACDEHMRYLRVERQRKQSSLSDYQSVIGNDLLAHFGASTPVRDITALDIEGFKTALFERGLSNRTVQKVLVILHGVMGRAMRKGWITANPCEDVDKVKVASTEGINVLDADQVEAVARAADELFSNLIRVAAFTGLRLGELRALRWRHIDWTGRGVRVERNYVNDQETTPKSGKTRSVPLSRRALVALDALSRRENFTAQDDLVFCNEVGAYLSDDVIRRRFAKALKDAGLGYLGMRFHDLRHTFGTLAITAADILKVQEWMGHADIQTTRRYLHYAPRHDDAERLDAAFDSQDDLLPDDDATRSEPTRSGRA